MIEVNVWEYWIMKQIMTKFDGLKIDSGGETMMSSDAIYHSDVFVQYLYRQVQFFVLLYRFHNRFFTVKIDWKALEPSIFQLSQPVSRSYPLKY